METIPAHPSVAARAAPRASDPPFDIDQRVILRGMRWKDYEVLLAVRGDRSGVRMYFSNGEIELMSPSRNHEAIKSLLGRLLEAYADERGIDLNAYGSWTLKDAPKERGAEPDECYVVGPTEKDVPDLAIEVVWTHGGVDKLDIYRKLGVGELWVWERESGIRVFVLRDGDYQAAAQSALFPELDLGLLGRFLDEPSQSRAVREFRAALRK